ncbi:MAG: hypothetical protein WB919_00445, partial [Candidatus Sulfotelmatobacter sp.]
DLSFGDKDSAASALAFEAQCYALLGLPDAARRPTTEIMAVGPSRDAFGFAALILARIGDAPKSSAVLTGLNRDYPGNRYLQIITAPLIHAAQALHNQAADAIADLEPLRPFEFGSGPESTGYEPNYLRGLAYLKLGDGAKAAAEFQSILDHQGVIPIDPEYSLSHLQLARAYALQGDSAKAKTAYQDFFALWKDADPDVPILTQAKAEYEKLK